MCKTVFNKNQNYTSTDIGKAVLSAQPGRYKDLDSCVGAINIYIKQQGIVPVNGQKNHRVFSGLSCQKVFEHFAPAGKQLEMKMVSSGPETKDEPMEGAVINNFDLSNLSTEQLRSLKSELDELILSRAPEWDSMKPGEKFNYRGYNWVCLDPEFKSVGGIGCLAIMADIYLDEFVFNGNDSNNYLESPLREKLYEIGESLQNEQHNILISHNVDTIMENGEDKYGSFEGYVFPLSIHEYIRYAKYVPRYDVPCWLRSPYPSSAYIVRIVYTDGSLDTTGAGGAYGVAPACIFNRHI